MKLQLTNEDKSRKLATKARDALLQSAGRDWTKAKESARGAVKLELEALNALRDCGIKLQEAADHEQVSFQFYHQVEAQLPKDLNFKSIKLCIHLARNFEKPIATLDEARSARQMMFEAFGASAAPGRLEEQTAHDHNPWSEFVSKAASFTSLFEEIEADKMDKWEVSRLDNFIRTTEPIVQKHAQAKQLFEAWRRIQE